MARVWTLKKKIALAGAVSAAVLLVLLFVPMYRYTDPSSAAIVYTWFPHYAILAPWDGGKIFFLVSVGLMAVSDVFGAIRLIGSVNADPDVGDKEDKDFVFGFFFLTLGAALYGLGAFSGYCYIPMGVSLLLIALYIGALVYHFKSLSSF